MLSAAYTTGYMIDRDYKITRREVIRKQRQDREKASAPESSPSSSPPIPENEKHSVKIFGFSWRKAKTAEDLEIEKELKRRLTPEELLDFPLERARLRSLPICQLILSPASLWFSLY